MFGIKSIFGSQPQEQQQVQQQQQQVAPQPAPQPAAPQPPAYANLWQAQQQQQPGLNSPLTVNQQEVFKLAQGKKFLPNGIPQDVLAAMQQGDFSKFGVFFNQALQVAYAHAMTDAMNATSASFDSYGQRIEQYLPNVLQNFQVTTELSKSNPLMNDPAFAPMVQAVAQQMRTANPTASAQDVQKQVEAYFADMATRMGFQKQEAQPQQTAEQQQQSQEVDWGAFGGFDVPAPAAAPVATGQPTVSTVTAGPSF